MGQGLLKMNKISKLEINLINLFQGNLPLYQSYWFYYVLGNFAISAPLLIITKIQIQKVETLRVAGTFSCASYFIDVTRFYENVR